MSNSNEEKTIDSNVLMDLLRHKVLDNPNRPGFKGGIFYEEVTHQITRRRADALFLGMTNAKGRFLYGYEIKVSRADWLRELKHSHKADSWADESHSWTIVTVEGVVKEDELPSGFGLLVAKRAKSSGRIRLVSEVSPVIHKERTPSWEAISSFMARGYSVHEEEKTAVRREAGTAAINNAESYRNDVVKYRKKIEKANTALLLISALEEKGIKLTTSGHEATIDSRKILVSSFPPLLNGYLKAGENLMKAAKDLEQSVRSNSSIIIQRSITRLESELREFEKFRDKVKEAEEQ